MFETLEARQLMSVVPSVALMATPTGAAGTSMHAPLVAKVTAAATTPAANAGVTGVVGGNGTGGTPTGGGTVAAKKSLWDRLKGAAKWVKNHVVIGLHNIGIKGTF